MKRRWLFGALGGIAVLGGGLVAAQVFGLATIERHHGYFAPVWDGDGRRVYFIRRNTFGITWGPGWEHFSPPGSTPMVCHRKRSPTGRTATASSACAISGGFKKCSCRDTGRKA